VIFFINNKKIIDAIFNNNKKIIHIKNCLFFDSFFIFFKSFQSHKNYAVRLCVEFLRLIFVLFVLNLLGTFAQKYLKLHPFKIVWGVK
jgi:hypothetical protein